MFKAILACAMLWCAGVASVAYAAPAVEAYGRLPAIEDMVLSPNGKSFAFASVEGEERRLFVRSMDGAIVRTVSLGKLKIRSLAWADDGHLLISVSQALRYGTWVRKPWFENLSVICLNVRTGSNFRVFADKGAAYGPVFGFYGSTQGGGRSYGYFRTFAMGQDHALVLFRVDLDTGELKLAADGERRGYDWVLDAQGDVAARSYFDVKTNTWTLLAGGQGDRVLFSKVTPTAEVEMLGLGRKPGTILLEDATGDADAILEVPMDGGKPQVLFERTHGGRDLYDPTTRLFLGAIDERNGAAVFYDPLLQKRYDAAVKPFAKYHVVLKSRDAAFDRLILYTDGADDSGTYWLVDLADGKASALAQAYPDIKPADVGPSRLVDYTAADGLAMTGVLTLPPGRKAEHLPLVLLPHGGPIGYSDEVGFDWWAQAFAARGYAVFQPNYRGSGGSGARFREAGYGEWGRKMQTDLSDGVVDLAGQGLVDPRRVCIVGASYGGYAALAGVTLQTGLYRCAVSYGGVSDLGALLGRDGGNSDTSVAGRYMRRLLGGTWSGDPVLKDRSPLFQAARADAPILLIHGKDDTVVPISDSEHMDQRLHNAGKAETFIRLDGEDHWLSTGKTRTQMLTATVEFVMKNNPPDPAPVVASTTTAPVRP